LAKLAVEELYFIGSRECVFREEADLIGPEINYVFRSGIVLLETLDFQC
jgi:hypothetical protein